MSFRIEFSPQAVERKITHKDKIFLIGSCFSENLGNKLLAHKFQVLQNPHGVLFNPFSIAAALEACIDNKKIQGKDLFYFNEAYHSWSHHSMLSNPILEDATNSINVVTEKSHHFLAETDIVIITLGSAFGYELTEAAENYSNNFIVANNHKAPSSWFTRKLADKDSIKNSLTESIEKLRILNPKIEVIFTVSPVRHLREGFVENNRSKGILLSAVHELCEEIQAVTYFPAYELVIDDLRDYRFYAEDMVHPNYAATNYVWQKFQDVNISAATKKLITQIEELNMAVAHKPFNPTSEAHKKFKLTQLQKTKELAALNLHINFEKEINFFSEG